MFEDILARLAAALRRHDILSIVIGGQAVLLHGEPRLTRDIDVTLGVGEVRNGRKAANGQLSGRDPAVLPRFSIATVRSGASAVRGTTP